VAYKPAPALLSLCTGVRQSLQTEKEESKLDFMAGYCNFKQCGKLDSLPHSAPIPPLQASSLSFTTPALGRES